MAQQRSASHGHRLSSFTNLADGRAISEEPFVSSADPGVHNRSESTKTPQRKWLRNEASNEYTASKHAATKALYSSVKTRAAPGVCRVV